MPRLARPVFAGVPHHVTQRGNRRENVFFSDADREAYLEWLSEYGAKHGVEILAYCLMTNHIHVVAVPGREDVVGANTCTLGVSREDVNWIFFKIDLVCHAGC